MNWFENIIYTLSATAEAPASYGAFHLILFAAIMIIAVFLGYKMRGCTDKTYRRTMLIIWCILVVLEIYRELVFAFSFDGEKVSWDYAWYLFPFQLCSSPLYLLPFAIFLKDGKVRNGVLAYLATFSLFGGLAVMLYPGDVLTVYVGINYQALIHHGLQVIVGILTIQRLRGKLNLKTFLYGVAVFAVMLIVAMILNICGYHLLRAAGMGDTFNMFYISPYFSCTLPILCDVYNVVPYPIFLLIYSAGFAAISALIFYVEKSIFNCMAKKVGNGNKNKKQA